MPDTWALVSMALSVLLVLWPMVASSWSEWMDTYDFMWSWDFLFRVKEPSDFRSRWEEQSPKPSLTGEDQTQGPGDPARTIPSADYWFIKWDGWEAGAQSSCVCSLGQLKLIWRVAACPVSFYKLVLAIVIPFWFMWTKTVHEDQTPFVLKLPKSTFDQLILTLEKFW